MRNFVIDLFTEEVRTINIREILLQLDLSCPKGGTVLDPFGGAGTTALVALRHGREAILIELNPEYAEISERRIRAEWHEPVAPKEQDFGPLFKEIKS